MNQGMNLAPVSGFSNKANSTAGGATALTYNAPGTGLRHVFGGGIFFGFATAPAAACYFTITIDGTETHRIPVTAAGAGFFPLLPKSVINPNKAVSFGLTGDGAAAVGYISMCQHGVESVC